MAKRTVLFLTMSTCALLITGCANTSKAIDHSSEQFSQGNYLAGVWSGTMGVFVSAMVDVVTLGGTTDAESGSATIMSAATAYNAGKNKSSPPSPVVATTSRPVYGTTTPSPARTTNTATRTQTSTPAPVSNRSGGGSPQQAGNSKSYRAANQCMRRDTASNSLADFWENHCGFPTWVAWVDRSGGCRNGCAAGPIQPGRKESVTKSQGGYEFASCEYPGTPKGVDRKQWRGGQFLCF